jgi:hypothetical protein
MFIIKEGSKCPREIFFFFNSNSLQEWHPTSTLKIKHKQIRSTHSKMSKQEYLLFRLWLFIIAAGFKCPKVIYFSECLLTVRIKPYLEIELQSCMYFYTAGDWRPSGKEGGLKKCFQYLWLTTLLSAEVKNGCPLYNHYVDLLNPIRGPDAILLSGALSIDRIQKLFVNQCLQIKLLRYMRNCFFVCHTT